MGRLGINLSFAVKRYPEPEAWAEFVRERLRLDEVQFTFDLLDPWWPQAVAAAQADRVRSAAEAFDLRIHGAFMGLAAYTYNGLMHPEPAVRGAFLEWHRRAIELTARMGGQSYGGPLGGQSVRQAADAEAREAGNRELLASIVRLSQMARENGLQSLLVEPTPLPRELPSTIDNALSMAEELEGTTAVPVRFCIDVGHALYAPLYGEGAVLRPWLERLRRHVGMVHLQQTDGQSDSHWGFTQPGVVTPEDVAGTLRELRLQDVPTFLEVFYPFELSDERAAQDITQTVALCRDAFAA